MKVLIDEDLYPDLYAKLSDARHSRARAEMLRRWASMYLKLENGEQVLAERRYPTQVHAQTPASGANHTAPTNSEVPQRAIPPAPSRAGAGGLSLPTNASNALVAGMGKYLS
ncbi:MAG: hypothetical protein AB1704_20155 [Pseudomonadota bacterium]